MVQGSFVSASPTALYSAASFISATAAVVDASMPASVQPLQLLPAAAFLAVVLLVALVARGAPVPSPLACESLAIMPALLESATAIKGMAMGCGLRMKLAASFIRASCSWKRSALQAACASRAPHSWATWACTLLKLLAPCGSLAAGGL